MHVKDCARSTETRHKELDKMSDEITLAELPEKIAQAAAKSADFRSAFIADPKGTIEKYSDLKLPEGLQVFAHEQSSSALHFVLPPKAPTGQLSEDDLERVAGGAEVAISIGIAGAGLAISGVSAANDAEQFW